MLLEFIFYYDLIEAIGGHTLPVDHESDFMFMTYIKFLPQAFLWIFVQTGFCFQYWLCISWIRRYFVFWELCWKTNRSKIWMTKRIVLQFKAFDIEKKPHLCKCHCAIWTHCCLPDSFWKIVCILIQCRILYEKLSLDWNT